jgi:hypothetical protein
MEMREKERASAPPENFPLALEQEKKRKVYPLDHIQIQCSLFPFKLLWEMWFHFLPFSYAHMLRLACIRGMHICILASMYSHALQG